MSDGGWGMYSPLGMVVQFDKPKIPTPPIPPPLTRGCYYRISGDIISTFANNSDFDVTTGDFTLSFWIKGADFGDDHFLAGRGTNTVNGWYLETFGNKVYLTISGTGMWTVNGWTITDNVWNMITLRKSGVNYSIIKDAIPVINAGLGNCISSNAELIFISPWGGLDGCVSQLSEVTYYNRALTDTEIAKQFNFEAISLTNLVAYWRCANTSGLIMPDDKTTHDGTLVVVNPLTFYDLDTPWHP